MESSSTLMKSDSSSEDIDHNQEHINDESGTTTTTTTTTTRRSYECTYCKRGFTNAQALGGHMNIHRKDRAKAKQNDHHHQATNSSFCKSLPNEDYFGTASKNKKYYVDSDYTKRNYHMHLPSMVPSPTFYHHPQQVVYFQNDFSMPRSNEDNYCSNLSLGIGSTYLEDREVTKVNDEGKCHEVDLVLRLGPDP